MVEAGDNYQLDDHSYLIIIYFPKISVKIRFLEIQTSFVQNTKIQDTTFAHNAKKIYSTFIRE